jgi:hypothetical protein
MLDVAFHPEKMTTKWFDEQNNLVRSISTVTVLSLWRKVGDDEPAK